MRVTITWAASEVGVDTIKAWHLSVEDFNNEIPKIGDLIRLYLPIPETPSFIPIAQSSWSFKIIKREWSPEPLGKSITLAVTLTETEKFFQVPIQVRSSLKEVLEKEEIEKAQL